MFKRLMFGKQIDLMVADNHFDNLDVTTNFGGNPVFNEDSEFTWPVCKSCGGNMQYLGKINYDKDIFLLFMCQNDPGCCDDWDPDYGANKAIRFAPVKLKIIIPPATGIVTRETAYGAKIISFKDLSYNEARNNWAKKNKTTPRSVLGLVGGEPEWLQNDDTPDCSECGEKMEFIAQLEIGPDYKTDMNFGGDGCAYVFRCKHCELSAKFLWQC